MRRYKSWICMADGVAMTIGENSARAAMRLAGHRAAVDLLEALPLVLPVEDAVQRAGPVMAELGFVSAITLVDEAHLSVVGNAMRGMLNRFGLEPRRRPACYYTVGLYEGLVHVLSKTRVSIVQQVLKDDMETWTLQRQAPTDFIGACFFCS